MTRVALFGGSFNPPHIAHALVALYVRETQPVDEVWFVPVYAHAFGKDLAPYEDRIAMCELVARSLGPGVRVSRAEQELAAKPGFTVSRTLDLLIHLEQQDPSRTYRNVIGADILGETHKWYRWDDVVAKAPLIAIGRSGHAAPPGSIMTGVTMPEISATRVRDLLRAGDLETASQLLPREVLRYIAEHTLYTA